jgi:fructosamine-3-kinase
MSRPDIVAKLQKHGLCRHVNSVRQLSGGCISSASCYHTDQGMYFVKASDMV